LTESDLVLGRAAMDSGGQNILQGG
jgi:hypothetical protein